MIKDDQLYLIGSEEIYRLMALLDEGNALEARSHLDQIISSKNLTLEGSTEAIIHFE